MLMLERPLPHYWTSPLILWQDHCPDYNAETTSYSNGERPIPSLVTIDLITQSSRTAQANLGACNEKWRQHPNDQKGNN